MKRQCGNCSHYVPMANAVGQGRCHCHPPTVLGIPIPTVNKFSGKQEITMQEISSFPPVQRDCSGCGEYQEKREREESSD